MHLVSPAGTVIEETIKSAVDWLRLGIEVIGAVIVAVGIVAAIVAFLRQMAPHHDRKRLRTARTVLAHYLAIALEFQLAADILSTALAPTWDQIGKLAAIAAIRTALNYFLSIEMRNESSDQAPLDARADG